MSKFRKRPVVVEAIQWQPDHTFGDFPLGSYRNRGVGTDRHGVEYTICEVGLQTKEGFMRIKPGDWIITGVEGERYACDGKIFEKTYEAVDSNLTGGK